MPSSSAPLERPFPSFFYTLFLWKTFISTISSPDAYIWFLKNTSFFAFYLNKFLLFSENNGEKGFSAASGWVYQPLRIHEKRFLLFLKKKVARSFSIQECSWNYENGKYAAGNWRGKQSGREREMGWGWGQIESWVFFLPPSSNIRKVRNFFRSSREESRFLRGSSCNSWKVLMSLEWRICFLCDGSVSDFHFEAGYGYDLDISRCSVLPSEYKWLLSSHLSGRGGRSIKRPRYGCVFNHVCAFHLHWRDA